MTHTPVSSQHKHGTQDLKSAIHTRKGVLRRPRAASMANECVAEARQPGAAAGALRWESDVQYTHVNYG